MLNKLVSYNFEIAGRAAPENATHATSQPHAIANDCLAQTWLPPPGPHMPAGYKFPQKNHGGRHGGGAYDAQGRGVYSRLFSQRFPLLQPLLQHQK